MSKSTKTNICLFCLSLEIGGAQRVISNLSKELVNDYNVTIILFYNIIAFDLPEDVKVIVLSNPKSLHKTNYFNKFSDYISCTIKFVKLIKSHKIDISVSFLPAPNFVNGIARTFNKNLKTIISERRFTFNDTMKRSSLLLAKLLYPLLYNRNTALFSNSIYINEDLKKRFNIKIPMHVIYNPVVVPEALSGKHCNWEGDSTFKIINVGRVVKNKNQKLIIDALKQLNDMTVHLSVIGDGNLKEPLNVYAQENNLGNIVSFLGPKSDVFQYLLKSNCFVLSSYTEGFPNVVLEAMALGLPVISTNCLTGPLELLNENEPITINKGEFYKAKYGLLVNNDDIEAMAKAIDYFKQNEKERIRYGKLGLEKVKEFDLKVIGKQVSSLINSL